MLDGSDRETRRRKDYVNATDIWTKGWSDSALADPVPSEEMKRRLKSKQQIEKAWQEYRKSLEEHKEIDARIWDERNTTEGLIQRQAEDVAQRYGEAREGAAGDPPPKLKVTESVEVLGPTHGALLRDMPEGDGAPPVEADRPRRSRWRFW